MLNSELCSILGIEYPIFQGGMAWIADGKLAAAVSEAGGLGIISAMNAGADYLKKEIETARSLTKKPFGVNIMLMSPHVAEVAQVVADLKVPVVTTGAGNPAKFMPMWQEAGIKVIPVIPSVMLAKRMEKLGAVAVVAEGGESGGHIGELNTMALVPQVADALSIPVIAAGGIGDGRGIAAAFMLGAKGVQMGTRFLVANECGVHPNYKAKVLKASDIDTIVTGRKLGHPVRSLKTSFSRNFFMKENDPSISNEELESAGIGALRAAAVDGDDAKGCFIAGQIAGMVNREQSAKEIIDELVSQAEALLKGTKWVK
ncbi:MAG: enoyl-[acyl-carrier-protein] reductase FabK [Spirochaetia bacterium]|nr:enoyl-[acyl-carrier-protein] reductase FabK [Bacteroidaceae bacterium]MBO7093551.1 enoyl-[acyl-carrier-protein] reductase FabK [Spirochaetia bacterium]